MGVEPLFCFFLFTPTLGCFTSFCSGGWDALAYAGLVRFGQMWSGLLVIWQYFWRYFRQYFWSPKSILYDEYLLH